ncbi:MAG: hypothetical protein J6K28_05040 [Alistipes sp.]|nr:hypothetical protein [Alistipes sp.]
MYSVVRQTPVATLLTLIAVTAAAFTRFSLGLFDDECIGGTAAPLAVFVDAWQASHRELGTVFSAILTVFTGMIVGRMGAKFGIYSTHCIFSVALYGFAACGIFISENSLSAAIAAMFAAAAMRHLCGGYLRGQNLTAMLYAGLYTGIVPMFCAAGVIYVITTSIAVFMFALSVREIITLFAGIAFIPLTVCYVTWMLGGDFLAPLHGLLDALIVPSGYTVWGSDSFAALVMVGLLSFVLFCSVALFFGNRYAVATKSRRILIYIIITCILSVCMLLLPSATVATFTLIAVPASLIMPVMFLKIDDAAALLLYLIIVAAFVLHLFVI